MFIISEGKLSQAFSRSPKRRDRSAAAIVMKISYGHDVSDKGDAYVTIADEAMQGLGKAGIFGTYLVDYLPFRKFGVHKWPQF